METIRITVGDLAFRAVFEAEKAPATVAAFRKLLPYRQRLIQARWSGEAGWVPLGDFYPGGFSETEILFPYGRTNFASTMGQLAGNHFLTIVEGRVRLPEVGRRIVWEGAQPITFETEEG
jgi:hypothetical protein